MESKTNHRKESTIFYLIVLFLFLVAYLFASHDTMNEARESEQYWETQTGSLPYK